ncbi:MAG: hypothetical protein ACREA9_00210 [Pyrinomonadaceae bacterium]
MVRRTVYHGPERQMCPGCGILMDADFPCQACARKTMNLHGRQRDVLREAMIESLELLHKCLDSVSIDRHSHTVIHVATRNLERALVDVEEMY